MPTNAYAFCALGIAKREVIGLKVIEKGRFFGTEFIIFFYGINESLGIWSDNERNNYATKERAYTQRS